MSIKIAGTARLLQTADSITERLSCPDQPKLPDSGRITGKTEVIHVDTASTSTLTERCRERCLTVASLLKTARPRTKRFPGTASRPSYIAMIGGFSLGPASA